MLPTIVNYLFKETTYSNMLDFLEKRSHNLVPNLFGALIVCSFIKYLSESPLYKFLTPNAEETFSQYRNVSVQELRFALSEPIQLIK